MTPAVVAAARNMRWQVGQRCTLGCLGCGIRHWARHEGQAVTTTPVAAAGLAGAGRAGNRALLWAARRALLAAPRWIALADASRALLCAPNWTLLDDASLALLWAPSCTLLEEACLALLCAPSCTLLFSDACRLGRC